MGQQASEGGANYDLYHFITHPGARGIAMIGQACSKNPKWRISMSKAYGSNQCQYFGPPSPIDCSKPANRIALTAEVKNNMKLVLFLHIM
jgi:hypothetical protein